MQGRVRVRAPASLSLVRVRVMTRIRARVRARPCLVIHGNALPFVGRDSEKGPIVTPHHEECEGLRTKQGQG